MTQKQDKIKRFKELAKLNEVEEIDASLVELPEEVEVEAPKPVVEEYRMSAEEIAHMEILREQKKVRFAQLAGLVEEGAEAPAPAAPKKSPKMVLENAAPQKAKFKLSSLSEGLRKEVAALVKEGKTKISQFPAEVKAKVLKEMSVMPMAELGMAAPAAAAHPGYPELNPLIDTMGVSVRNVILKMMDAHGFIDGDDPEMPYKADYIMKGIINKLQNDDALD